MLRLKKVFEKVQLVWQDSSRTYANTPRDFKPKDWKNALIETKNAFGSKSIPLVSAGIAYFLTFAVFPAIAAFIAILSFALSKDTLSSAAGTLYTFLPTDIASLFSSQVEAALNNPSSGVIIIIFGIAIALISLSGAMANIIKAVNSIYEVDESRKILQLRAMSLLFIAAAGVITAIVVCLLVLNETNLLSTGIPYWLTWLILISRWFVIAFLVTFGLAIFYRYAPDRKNPHWQWVTWGSLIATLVWLLATTLFFLYARYFAHYTESYSVFAGILVLMIWLNLTSFAVLLGATINYKLENQTRVRTVK
ncbi:MAG: YihY/virulence factor BrkB family protein [Candidatus Microsaccharimonas sp.]